jgi:hypothetical protein
VAGVAALENALAARCIALLGKNAGCAEHKSKRQRHPL